MKMSATFRCLNAPFFWWLAVVVPHQLGCVRFVFRGFGAAAINIERNTLERRRAHHFDIW
jgi:hypothetical protein